MKLVTDPALRLVVTEAEFLTGYKLGEIIKEYIISQRPETALFQLMIWVGTRLGFPNPEGGFVHCSQCAFWHNRPWPTWNCSLSDFFMIPEYESLLSRGLSSIIKKAWGMDIREWKLPVFLTHCLLYHHHMFIGEREKVARKLVSLGMTEQDWQTLELKEREELRNELAKYAPALVPNQSGAILTTKEEGKENG